MTSLLVTMLHDINNVKYLSVSIKREIFSQEIFPLWWEQLPALGGAGGGDCELPAQPLHCQGGTGYVRLPPPPPRHLPHRPHHGEQQGS